MHIATLPTVLLGHIENPFSTLKPSHYEIKDLKTLISSAFHTYHHEKTEPISVPYQNMKQTSNFFEINHIDLCKSLILYNAVCIVQPSQNLVPRVAPSLTMI